MSNPDQFEQFSEADTPPPPPPEPRFGPPWLYDDDEVMVNAREQLLGDYNMWVQLAGGTRQKALELFVEDYPKGPLKAGEDTNLRSFLGKKFPWLFMYQAFEYRAGIFNTVTFVVMGAILAYIAFVYQPRPKPNPDAPGQVLVTPDDTTAPPKK